MAQSTTDSVRPELLIQGVAVSDFLTPHFYDPIVTPGTRYSLTGALKAPRQIMPGSYISWVNPESDDWQQLRWIDPNGEPSIVDLGSAQGTSLRAWIDDALSPDATPRGLVTDRRQRHTRDPPRRRALARPPPGSGFPLVKVKCGCSCGRSGRWVRLPCMAPSSIVVVVGRGYPDHNARQGGRDVGGHATSRRVSR